MSDKVPNVLDLMPDAELAGTVRMMMRNDLMHEPLCVAARDRILKLSRERFALLAALKQWVDYFDRLDRDAEPDDRLAEERRRFHAGRMAASRAAIDRATNAEPT